jgi:DNA repair/transcription protein MET18/MMS19
MSRYTPYDSVLIIKALFSIDEAFKKHNATTRLEFYKLIDDLVVNHRASLQSMKNTFVEGFVSLTARERDPRNLMIYLSTMRIVIIDFEYDDEQNTALWDAISRYFPIHFGHRPTDPFNITEGDLKLRLRSCIGASSRFAPLAFPFLIQKLDAQTTANVKVSS